MSWTLDSIGPMAHTARDVAVILDSMDNLPITPANCTLKLEEPIRGLRLGLPVDDYFWLESDLQVVSAVRKAVDALTDLGMELVEVEIPQIKGIQRAASVISMADAAAYHQERLESQPERFGEDVRTRLEWGMRRGGAEYALARQTGREWQVFNRTMFREQIDVLALPTTPLAAQPITGTEAISAAKEMLRFTYPFSLSGMPAISMPCGFTDDGFPVGIQLVAPGEAVLTQVANAYQQSTPWHLRRPEFPE
jgi:aspartyl-tRNA(Asn)/glutamyl-tRNA(Gln) amidotransferase subunit A